MSIARRPASAPLQPRLGEAKEEWAHSAWTSTRKGRVPSTDAVTTLPASSPAILAQKKARRVEHLAQPAVAHLEDADLVRGAEAVLHGAQDPEIAGVLAFEIQHRVDHVLENARTGERPVLGDVSHEEDRDLQALGDGDELGGDLAHLADAARRGLQRRGRHRLDRVDDDRERPQPADLREHRLEGVLGEHDQPVRGQADPVGPQLDLPGDSSPEQ